MRQSFRLAWRSFRFRRRTSALLTAAVALSVMFMIFSCFTFSSTLRMNAEDKYRKYGEQLFVITGLDSTIESRIREDDDLSLMGTFQIAGTAAPKRGEIPVQIGTADEGAIHTARLRLSEGSFPEKADEIALERSALTRLAIEAVPGDSIEIPFTAMDGTEQTKTFRLTGLLENYSVYWDELGRDVHQELPDEFFLPVSGLVTEETAQSMTGLLRPIWLAGTELEDIDTIRSHLERLNAGYSPNTMVKSELDVLVQGATYYSEAATNADWTIIGIIAVAFVILGIIFNAFLAGIEKRRQQLALLRTVGATKAQARSVIFAEAFLIWLIGTPIGIAAGIPLSVGVIRLFALASGLELIYAFWWPALAIAPVVAFVCVLLAALVPALRAGRVSLIQEAAGGKKKTVLFKRAKSTPLRLMLRCVKDGKGRIVISALSLALCLFAVNLLAVLTDGWNDSFYSEKIADFSIGYNHYSIRHFDFPFYRGEEDEPPNPAGIQQVCREQLGSHQAVTAITPKFSCSFPKEKYDEYLMYDLSRSISGMLTDSENQSYGFPDGSCSVVMESALYNREALEQLKADQNAAFDVDAVMRGDEVLLVLPDYGFTEASTKTQINKYYVGENVKNAPEGTKIYTNTAFQEGDSLLFTLLEQPDETKEPKRTEKTVKIGGILKNVTDPFDGPGIIFGDTVLTEWGFPYSFFDLSIYTAEDADLAEAEKKLETIALSYSGMELASRREKVEARKQENRVNFANIFLLAGCVTVLGIVGLYNAMSSRIYSRRREFAMLRAVGMTRGQLLRMLLYEGGLYGAVSAVLGILGLLLCLNSSLLPLKDWPEHLSVWLVAASAAVCVLLGLLAVLYPARQVSRGNLAENVKAQE